MPESESSSIESATVRRCRLGLGVWLSDGRSGFILALAAFVVTLCLLGNRRVPPAPLLIVMGIVYAFYEPARMAVASIMCGFALALAFILALRVVPEYYKRSFPVAGA